MTRDEYVAAFLEGAVFAPKGELIYSLVSGLYDERQIKYSLAKTIEMMDDVARDGGISVKCRGCGEYYDIPCELSEFNPEYSYCNSGHGGAYHCAP